MRAVVLLTVLCCVSFGQSSSTADAKDAEIAALKAQVAALRVELEIATNPEVMRVRLAVADTQTSLKAAQEAAKSKPELPKPQVP